MANDAHISLVGTVITEPTNKQVNSSTVFSMRVAVNTTKKQEGSQYPASDIYDVSVWGKQGEYLIDKVKIKARVWVTGDMMMGEPWTDRQNITHVTPRVTANAVKVLSGGNYTRQNTQQEAPAETAEEAPPF